MIFNWYYFSSFKNRLTFSNIFFSILSELEIAAAVFQIFFEIEYFQRFSHLKITQYTVHHFNIIKFS